MDPVFWCVVIAVLIVAAVAVKRWYDDKLASETLAASSPAPVDKPVAVTLPTPAEAVHWAPSSDPIVSKAPAGVADDLVDGVVKAS